MDGQMGKWTDLRTDICKDGWMNGWAIGQIDGWTDA